MKRKKYPSDVTDEEWEVLKKYLPEPSMEGNRKYELRESQWNLLLPLPDFVL